VRTPVLLFAFALVVRLVLIALYPDPAYPDSYYYVDVARALAATGRLELDFVWIFAEVGGRIPDPAVLPIASNAHWLPLSSFLQVPFIAVLGPTAWASALPIAIVGSLTAPLTWAIARDLGASRAVGLGAALLTAVPAAGTVFMTQPENFAILQPLIAATLWLTARGLKGDARAYALAGLLVGLASLARNDGFIVGAAVGLVFVIDRARALITGTPPRIPFLAAVGCFGLYLVVMGPWYLRQIETFGSISPTSSSGYALWIRTIDEWNSITAAPSLGRFLEQGFASIAESRVLGLVAAFGQFAVIICSVVLLPFALVGAWLRRRSVDFAPFFLYTALVFLGAMLLYPLHVPGGAFIHSAVGLESHTYILAMEGVAGLVAWTARRRPRWDTQMATSVFIGAIVTFTMATAGLYALAVHRGWDATRAPRVALATELDRLGVPADARLMSIDAAGFKYFTGRGGVVTPNDPIETIEAVARAYEPSWLILERDDIALALAPVLLDQSRPPWIGPAAFSIPSADGGAARLALFPICLDTGDLRCLEPST
jgi:4-amino-4-deoxy-L-arabinose transferase-like glycosyltransferase